MKRYFIIAVLVLLLAWLVTLLAAATAQAGVTVFF